MYQADLLSLRSDLWPPCVAADPSRPTYLMIGLMTNPLYQRATLRTVSLSSRDWLVACVASKVERNVRMW